MGHSTSSGRQTETGRTRQQAPRYEMALDVKADAPRLVRDLPQGETLTVTNDTSDLRITRTGDDEYTVYRQWQGSRPDGHVGYTSHNSTQKMNRGQASKAFRKEIGERSTVRQGNETLLRYRRNR